MQTKKPVLILMAGLPGSGKSTLALAVGRRLGWPVIDKDTVKSGLLDLGADEELAAQASYVLLHDFARDLVAGQGLSVVLDTPSSYERVIQTCREIARDADAALCIIMCDASTETRAERLRTRERRSSHVTGIDEEAEAVIRERFKKLPKSALRLSTEGPAEDLVDEVVAHAVEAGNKEDDEEEQEEGTT